MKYPREHLIKLVKDYFSLRRNVLAVYLYGSCVSDRFTEASDIDIGLLSKNIGRDKVFDEEFRFRNDLEKILRKDVDVTILNYADLFLVKEVFTKGKILLIKDIQKTEQMKWYLLQSYWDFIPTLRIFGRNALNRLRHQYG